ncbi:MAG: efflux RND transporter periplasmic adaptor subunit [Alphaproteobacteria bacterium]|nr:efflux RND transporter periplasmic adaptor subunit [Alphaproteobacteria bacterium]
MEGYSVSMKKFGTLVFVLALALAFLPVAGFQHARAAEAATSPTKQLDKEKEQGKAKKPAENPSLVGVDPVRLEPLSQTIPIIGRLVAVQSGKVSAEVGGAVRKLAVAVGDHVEVGDLIARLDNEAVKAQLDVQQSQVEEGIAELGALQAELLLAEQNMKRQNDLKKSGAFSRAKHEDGIQNVAKARSNILRAKAMIETRKATRRLTEITLGKSEIRAPYTGVVSEKLTEIGAYVRAGDAIVVLVSGSSLEVEADVPSARLGGLRAGATVSFSLADGREFSAVVRALLPTENPMTRTRPVRFTPNFEAPVAGLADAQTVSVDIPLGANRKVLTVHKDAIIKRGDKSLVYIVADEVAEARTVRLGESTGVRIEIMSGLQVGESVIIRGNERLRPGAQVKIRTGS